jgi:hypothetical protein
VNAYQRSISWLSQWTLAPQPEGISGVSEKRNGKEETEEMKEKKANLGLLANGVILGKLICDATEYTFQPAHVPLPQTRE